jgi:hypothetical protein
MPGRRGTAGSRAAGSRLARLTGIVVVVLLAAAGVALYQVALRPASAHQQPPLPTRVLNFQTVGLIAQAAQPGSSAGQLLQLLGPAGEPQFSPLGQTQEQAGSPQWTADLMAGNSYIFIYLPSGRCLTGTGTATAPRLTLEHCNLQAQQRWRRTKTAVQVQGHEFYQYVNAGDGFCLTEEGAIAGPGYGAALQACATGTPTDQLIGFWWGSQ